MELATMHNDECVEVVDAIERELRQCLCKCVDVLEKPLRWDGIEATRWEVIEVPDAAVDV